jgi:3-oxoacyl-[acyl-carrier-protein] synthase III
MNTASLPQAVGLTALGTYVPSKIVTNHDLAKIVDTNDEWVFSRTGIKERRISEDNEFVSTLAFRAVNNLIEKYGQGVLKGVDMVIVATNTPDALFPSTAALIQTHFDLKAGAFDLLAACPGWIYALSAAHAYVKSGVCKKVLTIGSEALSKVLDWTDRTTCVLFGDGACAAIVQEVPEGYGFKSFVLGSDGAGGKHLHMKCVAPTLPDGTSITEKLSMNGREVFKFAVRVMESATLEALEKADMKLEDIALFIPHQANERIIVAAREYLKLAPEKVMSNVERYGNTSTASIGIAMQEALETNRIKDGDNLLLVTFGGGLTWASSVVRWYEKKF